MPFRESGHGRGPIGRVPRKGDTGTCRVRNPWYLYPTFGGKFKIIILHFVLCILNYIC